jgi:hypothetical protein
MVGGGCGGGSLILARMVQCTGLQYDRDWTPAEMRGMSVCLTFIVVRELKEVVV